MSEPRIGYMCGTDYQFEVGEASGGNIIFPSIVDLKQFHKCFGCGIVKVEVVLKEIIEMPTDFSMEKP